MREDEKKYELNNGVQRTRRKVSGPLTPDVQNKRR